MLKVMDGGRLLARRASSIFAPAFLIRSNMLGTQGQ